MSKKAFYGILIALIVPVTLFFIVDSLPKAAIPQPLFYDTVLTKVKKGKQVPDTVWQRIPDFTLTNQLGKKVSFSNVSLSDSGKITVVNFFFTHCTTICPGMTLQMKRLQQTVQRGVKVGDNTADYVQFMSMSIDPEEDSVAALKKWANRFQIDPVNWWLLTGDKKTIYDLSLKYMNLTVQDPKMDTTFPHTDIFVLIDKHGVIRARRDKMGNPLLYHSLDDKAMSNLAEDIVLLSLEKDPNEKSFLAGKLKLIAIVFLVAILLVGALVFIIQKKDPHVSPGLEKK
ncbi:MAG: SCO family protein [Bacteroidota bacterium]|nr:SCO family protein [Bacteroidota bacterium]